MSPGPALSPEIAANIERECICVAIQKAARMISRSYDAALKPVGLSNWQFTLLMTMYSEGTPTISKLANDMGMDRTTLTANLKPLERRGLLVVHIDVEDRRVRRLILTEAGLTTLLKALPLWEKVQASCMKRLSGIEHATFRAAMKELAL